MWESFTRNVELEIRPVFSLCRGTCTSIPPGRGFVFGGDTVCWQITGLRSLRGDMYLTSVRGQLVVS